MNIPSHISSIVRAHSTVRRTVTHTYNIRYGQLMLCDPPKRLGLPVRFWVTGRELRLFNCAENRLGIVRLGRY